MFDVTQSWGYALSKASQMMNEDFSNQLVEYEITARDFGILLTVFNNPMMTQKDIGELMKIDRTTMVQIIDSLEAKGLLSREINPRDRRQNLIRISELSSNALTKMWSILKESEMRTIQLLSPFQIQAIIDISNRFQKIEGEKQMNQTELLRMQIEATFSPMDYMAFNKENPNASVIVDVRNAPPHLKKEKIKGALEIPLNELDKQLDKLPKNKLIVVYCWDVWCNMAKKASVFLLEHGYQVKELSGGIASWTTLKLPVEPVM
jgi:DNA-binding MarR family transcriptional regulator/rhodanese-related sulfurtransferase